MAVIGSGPAGLACATTAARRGHAVTLYEAAQSIGGQLNLARIVPGKLEFNETIRYFKNTLAAESVELKLGRRVSASDLLNEVILATGVVPRQVNIEGVDHPSCLTYLDVLREGREVGSRVAIIGAGGIGFDIAEYITAEHGQDPEQSHEFLQRWGIDPTFSARGGIEGIQAPKATPARTVYLLQRKAGKPGRGLAKTTGWIHRASLRRAGVKMIGDCSYTRIDDQGLHLEIGGEATTLAVDTVIICAGQEPLRDLQTGLDAARMPNQIIGGADLATELDARRAIRQGTLVAMAL